MHTKIIKETTRVYAKSSIFTYVNTFDSFNVHIVSIFGSSQQSVWKFWKIWWTQPILECGKEKKYLWYIYNIGILPFVYKLYSLVVVLVPSWHCVVEWSSHKICSVWSENTPFLSW